VVVREATPAEALELALIENIHRKDLNPIEEAMAFQRLLENSGTTQEVLAKRLGKDRTTITNQLRLLNLPVAIQRDVIDGRLSAGHARVLAGVKSAVEQKVLWGAAVKKGLSVRQLEALAKRKGGPKGPRGRAETVDHYLQSVVDELKRSLGTKVAIQKRGKEGHIVIYFYSEEELDRLLERLG
jgi:ParB family chromosome partitioning protein